MATTYKVLAQSAPSATTNTDLYTVAANTSAVCSSVTICNRGSTSAAVRMAVRPGGATLANQHYVVYDNNLVANDTMILTIGVTLAATDVVTVYTSTANVSFSLFGSEITP